MLLIAHGARSNLSERQAQCMGHCDAAAVAESFGDQQ
jgi:hypothetical protein